MTGQSASRGFCVRQLSLDGLEVALQFRLPAIGSCQLCPSAPHLLDRQRVAMPMRLWPQRAPLPPSAQEGLKPTPNVAQGLHLLEDFATLVVETTKLPVQAVGVRPLLSECRMLLPGVIRQQK